MTNNTLDVKTLETWLWKQRYGWHDYRIQMGLYERRDV